MYVHSFTQLCELVIADYGAHELNMRREKENEKKNSKLYLSDLIQIKGMRDEAGRAH